MDKKIDHAILREDLVKYGETRGRGAWAELAKKSGVTDATISRAARGKVDPDPDTWWALHNAAPEEVRPPWDELRAAIPALKPKMIEGNATIIDTVAVDQFRKVPVFDAQGGPDGMWTDQGYPTGQAAEFEYLPVEMVDANSFLVRVHGDSMIPTVEEGDMALIVPSRGLENGCVCFATFPGEPAERMIKRYRKAGETIILESDNKKHDPRVLSESNGKGVRIFRVTRIIKKV